MSYHGCTTGDCPHDNVHDCVKALSEHADYLEKNNNYRRQQYDDLHNELKKSEADNQRLREALMYAQVSSHIELIRKAAAQALRGGA